MRAKLTITSAAVLAACGQWDTAQLYEAANQPDPDANGIEPQDELREVENGAENGTSLQ
jgi:hypothetical protein